MLKDHMQKVVSSKIPNKITAMLLILTMTLVNIAFLGIYFVSRTNSFAATEDLENQNITTGSPNVTFDAYFMNDENAKVHSIEENIATASRTLSLELNVKNEGYLKDGTIEIRDVNRRNKYKL